MKMGVEDAGLGRTYWTPEPGREAQDHYPATHTHHAQFLTSSLSWYNWTWMYDSGLIDIIVAAPLDLMGSVYHRVVWRVQTQWARAILTHFLTPLFFLLLAYSALHTSCWIDEAKTLWTGSGWLRPNPIYSSRALPGDPYEQGRMHWFRSCTTLSCVNSKRVLGTITYFCNEPEL